MMGMRVAVGKRATRGGVVGLALAALACAVAACGSAGSGGENAAAGAQKTEKTGQKAGPKIAAIYLSQFDANDYGKMWKDVLTTVAKQVNASDLRLVENVGYTDQLTQTTSALFRQGYKIVVDLNGGGPLFYKACAQAPEGFCLEYFPNGEMPKNTAGFWIDYILMAYLEGVGAGKVTKTGTIGFINAFKSPVNVATVNAYALGCQSVLPACKVRNVFLNSYFDPPREVEATQAVINNGADVIAHIMDGPTPNRVAQQRGKRSFGYIAADPATRDTTIATTYLTDAMKHVIGTEVQSIVNGDFAQIAQRMLYAGDKPFDLNYTFGPKAPPAAKRAMDAALAKLNAGRSPFVGPISDTTDKVRVPRGQTLNPRGDFVNFQWKWLVKGVG